MKQLSRLYAHVVAHPRILLFFAIFAFVLYHQSGSKNNSESPPTQATSTTPSHGSFGGGAAGSTPKGHNYKRMGESAPQLAADTSSDSSLLDVASSVSLVNLLTPAAHAQQNAMLIRNGHISAYVDSLAKSRKQVAELLKSQTAHIESENQSDEYNSTVLRLTLKVPAEKFQTLFDQLLKMSEKIRSHSINVEDVLKQYTDIKSRLENKKELQTRLRTLVQKAVKITDILEIERELARVSEEIDSSIKILKQYENDVRLSTISVDFAEPKTEISGPAPLNIFKKLGQAVVAGWEMVIDTLLEFVTWWPLWLVLGLGYFWYRSRKLK